MRRYLQGRNIGRSFHYLRAIFFWNKNDVLLASFPKSGNTWVRYFWLNYISQAEWNGRVIDFKTLDHIMPSFGLPNFFAKWEHKALPKAVASHWRYGFYFKTPKKVLIIRDPRDVMVSYFHYVNGKRNLPEFKDFSLFIRNKAFGLPAWFQYYSQWINKANIVLSYEELKENDVDGFRKIFKSLGIEYREELLIEASKASRFDKFKSVELTMGHSKPESNKEGFHFARKGTVGDYLNYFSEEDLSYYNKLRTEYKINFYK